MARKLEVSKLSCQELSDFLGTQFSDDILKKFREEEIDGDAYLGLTESILSNIMHFKAGQIVKILKHVASLNMLVHSDDISMPKCFKCSKELNSLKDLCHHLRHIHLLCEPSPISCAEGGCCRTFTRYNSFYRHFSTCHCQPVLGRTTERCADLVENGQDDTPECSAKPSLFSATDTLIECSSSTSQNTGEIKDYASQFLLSLTCASSMTLSQVNFVKHCVCDLMKSSVDVVRQSALDLINGMGCSSSDAKVEEFFNVLKELDTPFAGLDSVYKIEKYVSKLPSYVAPIEHVLGQRWHGADSKHEQKLVNDTFVYVSVETTLKHVLHWSSIWEEMISVDSDHSFIDVITSYFSGSNFRHLYCLLKEQIKGPFYPVVIQLYYDDFETANPIGSKAGLHKLGGFYFTVMNFSRRYKSKLDHIYLVALAKREDIAYYGMSRVIEPLVKELAILESGFDVILENGSVKRVVCILGNIVADNLGLHSILGYIESFSHSYCCDFCLGTADEFQTVFNECNLSLRSKEMYEMHCDTLQNSGTRTHVFGVKSVSQLAKLKYYHPTKNDTADIMHDILEGVAPYEVNLLLRDVVITRKLVDIEEFNKMLKCFNYSTIMSTSKPSEILLSKLQSSSGLGQHSHQMLVLMYVLPLIIGRYMTPDNLNWKLFLLLLEICELVFSPSLSCGHLSYLSELIAEHHVLFHNLYPDFRFKYKHHRMVHYPSIILRNGPLSQMWVMRYEAKHGYFKRLAHIMCNFRNVCKTLAGRNQMRQAVVWGNISRDTSGLEIGTGEETVIGAHREFTALYSDTTSRSKEAFLANRVCIFGTAYEPGYSLIVDMDADGYPVFGYIVKILVSSGVVSFSLRRWKVHGFDWKSRSYLCNLSRHTVACHQQNLLDYHPLYAYQCSDDECACYHIRLRHVLCSDN